MAIILTNPEIERLLNMHECISVFEQGYRDLAAGHGLSRPRSDIIFPGPQEGSYVDFKTMDGVAPAMNTGVCRIDLDYLEWQTVLGKQKRVQVPRAAGAHYTGLLLLFDLSTTELIGIVPDGIVQRLRVGATNGLAASYLARASCKKVGIIGAGWQAGAQLSAIAAVREIQEIRCFSRSADNTARFCEQMTVTLGIQVKPVSSPESAIDGVDVAICATSSVDPVFQEEWLQPGMHVSSIKRTEIPASALAKADKVFIHSRSAAPTYIHPEGVTPPEGDADTQWTDHFRQNRYPLLSDLVAKNCPGRETEEETTIFVNNIGTGHQFALLGALVYRKARAQGAGKLIPSEMFTQAEKP